MHVERVWPSTSSSSGTLCASGLRKCVEGVFEAAQKVEPEDIPERRDAVFHPDLLALLISPSVVGNRHLIDGDAEFGYFRRDFNLEAKSSASDRHVADNLAAKRLITGFDIGHVNVRAQVRKKRQPFVGDVVIEVQHARRLAHQKARAVNHIRVAFHNWRNHVADFRRVVFQIGILHNDDLARRQRKARLQRLGLARVHRGGERL